jgi:hypothetical protein
MQKKISELNEASAVNSNDYLILNQETETKKVSMSILNDSLNIPSVIEITGSSSIPSTISVTDSLPNSINLDASSIPSTISVTDSLPNSISVTDSLPNSINLDASSLPNSINLDASSIPSTISVTDSLPNSININWGTPPALSVDYKNIVGGLVNSGPFQLAEDVVVLDNIRAKCNNTDVGGTGDWPLKLIVWSTSSSGLGIAWSKIVSSGLSGGVLSTSSSEDTEVSSISGDYEKIDAQVVDKSNNKVYKVSMQSKNNSQAYIIIEKLANNKYNELAS